MNSLASKLLWAAIAVVGAICLGVVALTRGESISAIWLVLDPSAGGEARFALVPLILAQQVFVFLRLLIKVGYYAGMSEALTRAPSPEYSYVASGSGPSVADEPAVDRA